MKLSSEVSTKVKIAYPEKARGWPSTTKGIEAQIKEFSDCMEKHQPGLTMLGVRCQLWLVATPISNMSGFSQDWCLILGENGRRSGYQFSSPGSNLFQGSARLGYLLNALEPQQNNTRITWGWLTHLNEAAVAQFIDKHDDLLSHIPGPGASPAQAAAAGAAAQPQQQQQQQKRRKQSRLRRKQQKQPELDAAGAAPGTPDTVMSSQVLTPLAAQPPLGQEMPAPLLLSTSAHGGQNPAPARRTTRQVLRAAGAQPSTSAISAAGSGQGSKRWGQQGLQQGPAAKKAKGVQALGAAAPPLVLVPPPAAQPLESQPSAHAPAAPPSDSNDFWLTLQQALQKVQAQASTAAGQEAEISRLKAENSTLQADKARLERDLAAAADKAKTLQKDKRSLQQQRTEAEAKATAQLRDAAASIAKQDQQLTDLKAELASTKAELAGARREAQAALEEQVGKTQEAERKLAQYIAWLEAGPQLD